jgi:hypothetical protein
MKGHIKFGAYFLVATVAYEILEDFNYTAYFVGVTLYELCTNNFSHEKTE